MKKWAMILAVLLAVLTASAALAEDVAGDWYLHLFGLNEGSAISSSVFSSLGMKWDISLQEDGTGHAVANCAMINVTMDDALTWIREGDKLTVTVQGATQEFTLTDGKLTATINGIKLVWLRGELPPEYVEDIPFVAGLDAAAFDGNWECVRVTLEEDSINIAVEMTDMEARFLLENGNGLLVASQDNGPKYEMELMGELSETEMGTVLTLGPADELSMPPIRFMLREDGLLVGVDDEGGATCTYYLKKVEAE